SDDLRRAKRRRRSSRRGGRSEGSAPHDQPSPAKDTERSSRRGGRSEGSDDLRRAKRRRSPVDGHDPTGRLPDAWARPPLAGLVIHTAEPTSGETPRWPPISPKSASTVSLAIQSAPTRPSTRAKRSMSLISI